MINRKSMLFILILLALTLTACVNREHLPAHTVEAYYQALADKDAASMIEVSCAAWEPEVTFTLDSFTGVETHLDEDFICEVQSRMDTTAMVTCSGELIATYGAEDRIFPIDQLHKVITENAAWRFCGFEE